MKHLFCAEGLRALERIMRAQPLLAFDFDGTLAPIVDRPGEACVPAGVAQRLQRLASRGPVAVISGRRIDDLRPRLGVAPVHLVGNHGAEDGRGMDPAAVAALDDARALLHLEQGSLRQAGIVVEDKGASIALHDRLAPDPARARACIERITALLVGPLSAQPGKRVMNLVATAARDKAAALGALSAKLGRPAAVYVGDDVNDEPVFARRRPDWLTVRIGFDPSSAAQFFLQDLQEVPALLDRLAMQAP